ncbi:DUF4262 domain-containing protein [Dactylosporangium sp. CA-092794]|uniref:DUF4262 domain-containing protein n=1 Tax=Dactylosporangium sp. CA-092794 TaxID=3239929 RepID=UPI003D9476FC
MPDIGDFLQRQEKIIDTVGWAVIHILPTDDEPDTATPFAYTVGLTAHGYPELLIAGLPPEIAHDLLNDLAARVYDKAERFSHGQRISDLIAGYEAVLVEGEPTDDLLPGVAIARYGREQVRLLQVIWPDPQGRFPWDAGYSTDPHVQPQIARP